MDMMAQIDLNDKNWEAVILDDFTNNSWNTWGDWLISHPTGYYKAFIPEWPSGVSRGASEHQVYQRGNCQFDNSGLLQLVSFYEGGPNTQPLQCGDYDIPPGKTCDTNHQTLFYTTGKIETGINFLYGYFELKCSLPIHRGSFPAFWLWGGGAYYYNEIDIFEYSWGLSNTHHDRTYTCGLFCDNTHIPSDLHNISYARTNPTLPNGMEDLTYPHVFSCEWMPDHVIWYIDGIVVNEYTEHSTIPHHEMALKVNYAIDNYAVPYQTGIPIWFGSDEMSIDYVKVFQLKTDCETDEVIISQSDLDLFDFAVKNSIAINPTNETITIGPTEKITFRITDFFEANGSFEIQSGAEFTVITQDCPN